jgi:hypothetical protein
MFLEANRGNFSGWSGQVPRLETLRFAEVATCSPREFVPTRIEALDRISLCPSRPRSMVRTQIAG